MKKIFILFFILCNASAMFAQLPNTDIWLLEIKAEKDSVLFTNPVNITNRTGYDNQPAFSPDGKYILYTSIRDEKQSDIFKYDLKTKATSQFTNTVTSEYSPTFMPDGKSISVVMVEPDSAQRLWKIPIKGGNPELIMKGIDSIGYHCWLDETHVALFLITNPFQLVFTDINTEKSNIIVHDTINRGMSVQKNEGTNWFYYSYKNNFYIVDLKTNKNMPVCIKNYKGEDLCFLNPATLIVSDGSFLYKNVSRFADKGNDWIQIANLSKYGLTKISRMAVSPDGKHIAIVSETK